MSVANVCQIIVFHPYDDQGNSPSSLFYANRLCLIVFFCVIMGKDIGLFSRNGSAGNLQYHVRTE